MDKIERYKILSEIFFNKNKKVFIRKTNQDLHFCNIISIKKDSIIIKNFGPEQRAEIKEEIYWVQIQDIEKFKEVKE